MSDSIQGPRASPIPVGREGRIMSDRSWKMLCCLAFVAATGAAAGCGVLGSTSADSTPGNGLEKTKLRVAVQTVADAAPFWLAQEGGYFKAEGLEVEELTASDPQASLTKAISGESDISFCTYTTAFIAKAKGQDVKLVADGVFASKDTNVIVAPPDSPVKRLDDLPGKRIGVSAHNAASEILTREVLRSHGLDVTDVKFVPVTFPSMGAALQRRQVDAAFLPEPFLSSVAGAPVNAIRIYDAAKPGESTDGFPLTGYVAMGDWTTKFPKTMAAFQRAMFDATRKAGDRAVMEPLIVAHAKVDRDIASRMGWPGFVSELDPRRIQRVPDLLSKQDALKTSADTPVSPEGMAEKMIVPQIHS